MMDTEPTITTDEEPPSTAGPRPRGARGAVGALRLTGRRHLRLVALAAAVVVMAATGAGYVALASSGAPAPRAGATPAAPGTGRAATDSAAGPLVPGGSSGSAGSGAIACPMIPATTGGVGRASHLFTRTTADGVTIRAYFAPAVQGCGCGPIPQTSTTLAPVESSSAGSTSSSGPSPTAMTGVMLDGGSVSVELSDESAVGQGTLFDPLGTTTSTATPSSTTVTADPASAVSDAFGVAEGAPVWWVAVPVGPEVARATMTFADGSTDQMAPQDGVVVLAHQIDPATASSGDGPYEVRGTLQLLDSADAVVKTLTFPQAAPPPTPVPGSPPTPVTGSATTTPVQPPPLVIHPTVVCPDMTAPVSTPAG